MTGDVIVDVKLRNRHSDGRHIGNANVDLSTIPLARCAVWCLYLRTIDINVAGAGVVQALPGDVRHTVCVSGRTVGPDRACRPTDVFEYVPSTERRRLSLLSTSTISTGKSPLLQHSIVIL